jgi:uncharacterized protein YuzE
MKPEFHTFFVKTSAPPTIEVDSNVKAVYIRFKRASVAKTIPQPSDTGSIAIDLDSKGDVIGIEAIGFSNFSLKGLFKLARVNVPQTDFSRATYMPADLVPA